MLRPVANVEELSVEKVHLMCQTFKEWSKNLKKLCRLWTARLLCVKVPFGLWKTLPKTSIRHRSQQLWQNTSTFMRTKFSFVKSTNQQTMKSAGKFVQWVVEQSEFNANFSTKKIAIFCDEAHFHLNGLANTQNCRIWDSETPHANHENQMCPHRATVCTEEKTASLTYYPNIFWWKHIYVRNVLQTLNVWVTHTFICWAQTLICLHTGNFPKTLIVVVCACMYVWLSCELPTTINACCVNPPYMHESMLSPSAFIWYWRLKMCIY